MAFIGKTKLYDNDHISTILVHSHDKVTFHMKQNLLPGEVLDGKRKIGRDDHNLAEKELAIDVARFLGLDSTEGIFVRERFRSVVKDPAFADFDVTLTGPAAQKATEGLTIVNHTGLLVEKDIDLVR